MSSSFQMIDAGLLKKRSARRQVENFSGDDRNNAGCVYILNSKKLNIIMAFKYFLLLLLSNICTKLYVPVCVKFFSFINK